MSPFKGMSSITVIIETHFLNMGIPKQYDESVALLLVI